MYAHALLYYYVEGYFMPTKVEIFIDYVYPYCFLFEAALAELKHDRDIVVEIHPLELRPAPIPTLKPEDDYLPRIWKESVYPMAKQLKIPIRLPTISPQPRTEKAFIVLQVAQEHGKAEEYSHAMYRAFFQDNQDIGDDKVVVDLATSIGLEESDIWTALNSDKRRSKHKSDQHYATQILGIHSVPSVFIQGLLLPGVPSASDMKQAVDQVKALQDGWESKQS